MSAIQNIKTVLVFFFFVYTTLIIFNIGKATYLRVYNSILKQNEIPNYYYNIQK